MTEGHGSNIALGCPAPLVMNSALLTEGYSPAEDDAVDDGMSAAQARKSLFGSNPALSGGGDSLGLGGKSAISKYMKLANPGMFH
eukprot:CAMPEP_0196728916 /NCGR_PEP_ID=MMETSP1091-20130531/9450_1 /TAXON_ID=302021 /ORGANISM="Rhodomonas sp., Strain CCMP768" /LENGTH=84 /DNA_ID=CAMNT_0042071721 /DNA_START=185 /DNA_END=440 /DNA_ORIENTATION=-